MNLRLDAARTVANLVYPKLSAIDVNAHSDQPMVVQIVRFSDMPLEDQRAPTIDVIPDTAVTDAIAVAQDDDDADADDN